MKHNALFITAISLLAAALLTGCSQNERSAAETVSQKPETTTASPTETTAGSTAAPETVPAAVTEKTASAAGTAASSTLASAANPKTYAHRLEIMTAALGSRPVPEKYLDERYSGTIPKRAQAAIDAGRDMLGSCARFCADKVRDCLYVEMYYGFGGEGAQYEYSFFRLDAGTGEITGRIDTEDLRIGLRDVYGMFTIGGRLMLASYHGFYAFNDAFDEIVVIDPENEPLAGSTAVCDGKVYLSTPHADSEGSTYKVYDPATGTLTDADDRIAPEHRQTVMEYLAEQYEKEIYRVSAEETESGEQKLIFEWD